MEQEEEKEEMENDYAGYGHHRKQKTKQAAETQEIILPTFYPVSIKQAVDLAYM
jgi:hypothetical protein